MKVSIIIPSRNETAMLSVTVRSALEELKAVNGDGEVVVCDNSDEDIWRVLKTPNKSPLSLDYVRTGKVKLLHNDFPSIYSARHRAITESSGEYVFNTDSHTYYGRDVIKTCVEFMDSDKNHAVGMGFSPIGWITAPELFARGDIKPSPQGGIFGPWGRQYETPTKICWHFGFRVVRRDWFLNELGGYGFFAKNRVSWGGGEFYVALKTWLLGKECWTIPSSPTYHIGPFSKEVERISGLKYRTYGSSGQGKQGIGIIAAFYALGGEKAREYIREKNLAAITQYGLNLDDDWQYAKSIAEEDRQWILKNQKIDFWELLEKKPWMEGWGEDRWDQWKPQIKEAVSLNSL